MITALRLSMGIGEFAVIMLVVLAVGLILGAFVGLFLRR